MEAALSRCPWLCCVADRYSEKNVGYVAVSLLLRSGDTMMTLVINSIRNDLTSHSSPAQVRSDWLTC